MVLFLKVDCFWSSINKFNYICQIKEYNMEVKIKFTDFWLGFDNYHNAFVDVLKRKYNIVISDNPDYLIYSIFGYDHLAYEDCVKIFYVGENFTPDFNLCDYAIGFDIMEFGDRYMRLPLYVLYGIDELAAPKTFEPNVALNRKFCSFVVSNASGSPERSRFFNLLSEYKQVDSGGKYANNIGGPILNKKEFIRDYKFNIAFENSIRDGYTTEKIMEPMLVNSLPIYWGNRRVGLDFNSKSFIDASDYLSLESLVEHIVKLDTNDDEYLAILSQSWLNQDSYLNWRERILVFFEHIFEKPREERKYLSPYGYGNDYRANLHMMLNQSGKPENCKKKDKFWRWFK